MMHKVVKKLSLLTLLIIGSMSISNNGYSSDNDPLEPMNRAIFGFNEIVDDNILEPVAKGYRYVTPDPVERSVSNFFNNLGEINTIINSALQIIIVKTINENIN